MRRVDRSGGLGKRGMLDAMGTERGWPVISQEIQPDDIDLFIRIQAAVDVVDAVKVLKGSRRGSQSRVSASETTGSWVVSCGCRCPMSAPQAYQR